MPATDRPHPANLLLHGLVLAGAFGLSRWPAFVGAWAALPRLGPPPLVVVGGLWALSLLATWAPIGLYHLLDATRRPAWLYRHKIQPARPRPGQPTVAQTLWVGVFNHLVVLPLTLLFFYGLLRLRGWEPSGALPSAGTVILQLLGLTLLTDLFFYVGHRLLHRPWWMRHVHELHHRFTAPTGLASQYQHPVEFALTGVGPLALAGLVLAPDLATMALFAVMGSINVVATHSGYNLPFTTWAGHHDLHHARTVGNFGVTEIFDRLGGTLLSSTDRRAG